MILASLCEYYGYLKEQNKTLREGYSQISVTHTVSLSEDGRVVNVIPRMWVEDNKKKYPIVDFPQRTEKTAIDANIVEHRPLYLFGLEGGKDGFSETSKSKKSHIAFVEKNRAFFEGMLHPLACAFAKFIDAWRPENEILNAELLQMGNDYGTARIAFTLEGRPGEMLQELPEVIERWDSMCRSEKQDDEITAQCPVLGKTLPVARLHAKIKGVRGGQSSGCSLVCFNNEAENSYGKEQSYNSSVSVEAMRRYTEALNYLIRDGKHNRFVAGMTIVHFAMTKNEDPYIDYFNRNIMEDSDEDVSAQDVSYSVGSTIGKAVRGDRPTFEVPEGEGIEYCIFGLVPNSSRLAIRFSYRNTFGALRKNIEKYHDDFSIGEMDGAPPLWRICKQLTRFNSKDDITSDMAQDMLMCILQGASIPTRILGAAVRRIRTDLHVGDIRAGLIKAALLRKNEKYKEKITMALNKQNRDAAYLCGRLFAVLEKIQKDSVSGKLNRTVKDTFFTAASATPAVIFARMIPLAQKHLAKIENEAAVRYLDNLLTEIVDAMDVFPKTLSLEEQAEFILGYYQQTKDLYTKKTENKEEN